MGTTPGWPFNFSEVTFLTVGEQRRIDELERAMRDVTARIFDVAVFAVDVDNALTGRREVGRQLVGQTPDWEAETADVVHATLGARMEELTAQMQAIVDWAGAKNDELYGVHQQMAEEVRRIRERIPVRQSQAGAWRSAQEGTPEQFGRGTRETYVVQNRRRGS